MVWKLVLTLTALVLFSFPTKAEPVVIYSGTASLIPNMPVTAMAFSGINFSVSAFGNGFGSISLVPCAALNPCSAGTTVSLSGFSGFWGLGDVSGTMTIDGTVYTFVNVPVPTLPNISGHGSMAFTAGMVTIPFTDAATVTLTAPFSVTQGNLSGTAFPNSVGLSFAGSGTATLVLNNLGNGRYGFGSLIYTFQTPIPEPTTLILLTTGLLGIAVKIRHRKNR